MDARMTPAAELRPLGGVTKAEATYQEMRWRILRGVLEPGAAINQESLAAQLGVSVTPLREALRRLEAEGLVQLETHRVVTIAPLSARELREIYVLRLQLDPLATALAARNADATRKEEIGRLAHASWVDDPVIQLEMNHEFHRTIYSASDNRELTNVLDRLWDRTDRYRIALVKGGLDSEASMREHRLIAEAIAAGKSREVSRLMRNHLIRSRDLIAKVATLE
jgi:DNA-binding GntR family transcriptional regulator